jgi:hypothetical protein
MRFTQTYSGLNLSIHFFLRCQPNNELIGFHTHDRRQMTSLLICLVMPESFVLAYFSLDINKKILSSSNRHGCLRFHGKFCVQQEKFQTVTLHHCGDADPLYINLPVENLAYGAQAEQFCTRCHVPKVRPFNYVHFIS